jgi:hypothetical protein
MAFKPFEKSKADREPRGMKEGSPREEKLDARQARSGISPKGKGVAPAPKGNPFAKAAPFAKGGVVKKAGRGC